VTVTAADGTQTTSLVRDRTGRLAELACDVRGVASKRHPRDKRPAYVARTALTLSARTALQGSGRRWSCEVDQWYLKLQVG
jgi:hypothetical protein